MKNKILFLPSWFPYKKNPRYGKFIKNHAVAASANNDVHIIITILIINQKQKIKTESKSESNIRITYIYYKKIINSKISYLIGIYYLLKYVRNQLIKKNWVPDLIHGHVYTSSLPAYILHLFYQIPFIISEHSSSFLTNKFSLLEKIIIKTTLKKAELILPVSKTLEQSIKKLLPYQKFYVLPNTINVDIFNYIKKNNLQNKKKLVSITTISKNKGIYYLIESINRLISKRTDFHIDIIGTGPDFKNIKLLIDNLKLNNFITLHGETNENEIVRYLQKSDLFIQTSLYETFGIVYIEAMSCGLPVIAFNVNALNEIINDSNGIIVEKYSINGTVNAINYILDNLNKYNPQKIRQYITNNFSLTKISKEINIVYNKVIKITNTQ